MHACLWRLSRGCLGQDLGVGTTKEKKRITNGHQNFRGWWMHSLSWLWWWLQRCRHVSKLITLYPFNVFHLFCVYYTSIELKEKQNGLRILDRAPIIRGELHISTNFVAQISCINEQLCSLLSGHEARPRFPASLAGRHGQALSSGWQTARPPPTHHLNRGDSEHKWVPELEHSTLSPVPAAARMRDKHELCWATEILAIIQQIASSPRHHINYLNITNTSQYMT